MKVNFIGNSSTFPGSGKRSHWLALTLAGGLTVALSAAAIAGVFERDRAPATTAATQPAIERPVIDPAPLARSTQAEMTYILVGSQAEAEAIRSAISTDAAAYDIPGEQSVFVVALESPEQAVQFDAGLTIALPELMAAGANVKVLDLRTTAGVTSAPAVSVDQPRTLVYVVPTEADRIALVQAFSEDSALVSTEHVTRHVLVLESPTDRAIHDVMVGELMSSQGYPGFDIVYTR